MTHSLRQRLLRVLWVIVLLGLPAVGAMPFVSAQGDPDVALSLPHADVLPNQSLTVAVSLAMDAAAASISSVDLRITYDPALLSVTAVAKGALTDSSAWVMASNTATPGLIRIGLAGSAPITTAGEVVRITFTAGATAGVSALTITQGDLNEGAVAATLTHGQVTVNTPPQAVNDAYSVDEDELLTVAAIDGVLANDSDADGHALTVALVSGPTHGGLTLNEDGSFVYTPDADYFGADSFVYRATDTLGGNDQATVSLTVNPVNDKPVADAGGPYSVGEGGSVVLDGASATDVDHDDASLVFEWDLDNDGTFETTGRTPTFSAVGLDGPTSVTVSLRVRDPGNALSDVSQATVNVSNVAPTADPGGPYTVGAGGSIALDGSGSSDPAGPGEPLTYLWDLNENGTFVDLGATPLFDAAGLADTVVEVALKVRDKEGAESSVATTTVTVEAIPTYGIAGTVRYWQGDVGIAGVSLAATGTGDVSALSQATGAYALNNVTEGSVTVTPSKSDAAAAITSYDAALILRHVAAVELLSGAALLAADTNQAGGVSGLDASLILQHAVGLVTLPFVTDGPVWLFTPATRSYSPLAANQSGQDFTAILLGEVSGNWGAVTGSSFSTVDEPVTLRITWTAADRAQVDVILAQGVSDLLAVDIVLAYDAATATLQQAESPDKPQAWYAAVNPHGPGKVRVALAGHHAWDGEQVLLRAEFADVDPAKFAPTIERLWLNDRQTITPPPRYRVFMSLLSAE